jgi:hypothetical protein
MFERYTEKARRVIFFARYEASQFGSMTIETEHMLLGLLREDGDVVLSMPDAPSVPSIRDAVRKEMPVRPKVPTSVDVPLSEECKRILSYAVDEADRLSHKRIGTEHLLLGVMREEKCAAAQVLHQLGLRLNLLRISFASALPRPDHHELPQESRPSFLHMYNLAQSPVLPKSGVVPEADTALRIAEAVWTPLYGTDTIQSQTPLQAERNFNVWFVTGSGSIANDDRLFALILQADGRLLSVGRGTMNQ